MSITDEQGRISEEALLKILLDNTTDFIYFKDHQSRFILVNEAQASLFNVDSPEELYGKSDFDFYDEKFASVAFADEQEIMKSGKPLEGKEERETWPDGSVTWVSTTKVPIHDTDGTVIGLFGISRDITELKNMQLALQEAEQEEENP